MLQARQVGSQASAIQLCYLTAACVCAAPLLRQAGIQVQSSQDGTKRAVSLGLNVMVMVANHKIQVSNEPDSPPL